MCIYDKYEHVEPNGGHAWTLCETHIAGVLQVHISGGGPAGAITAISLAEALRSRDKVKVFVYDGRWLQNELHQVSWKPGRRHQVSTLSNALQMQPAIALVHMIDTCSRLYCICLAPCLATQFHKKQCRKESLTYLTS